MDITSPPVSDPMDPVAAVNMYILSGGCFFVLPFVPLLLLDNPSFYPDFILFLSLLKKVSYSALF